MKMWKLLLSLPLLLTLAACATVTQNAAPAAAGTQSAQHFSLTQTQTLAADYLLYLPDGYAANSGKRWPLIFFLHGAGERGTNVWQVTRHGPPKVDTRMTNFPFIVVSPQCPPGQVWSNDPLLALLNDVEKKYAVDPRRVYLTGLSLGGFGVWNLALAHPEKFAAIAPISGGGETLLILLAQFGDPARLAELKSLPVWAFHGAKDPVVKLENARLMINAMNDAGCTNARLTVYPDAGHDAWTQTYANPELYQWFLQYSR